MDNLIGGLVSKLRATGALSSTYFVFSSDNGLHMGEHDMVPGKLTAFDTDIHMPLIVVGPASPPAPIFRLSPRTSTSGPLSTLWQAPSPPRASTAAA